MRYVVANCLLHSYFSDFAYNFLYWASQLVSCQTSCQNHLWNLKESETLLQIKSECVYIYICVCVCV